MNGSKRINNLWDDLCLPWQACFELAWEAYCEDCVPIGAVVTDANGKILSRGRNRIYPRWLWEQRPSRGVEMAHAEMEALRNLEYNGLDQHSCTLFTTTEPCPMCMGTFYMSGLRTLHFAARDPYAGSVNMLGTTWYLSQKPIHVFGPVPVLESITVSLFVEQELGFHAGKIPEGLFWEMIGEAHPEGIGLGQQLYEQGVLKMLEKSGLTAGVVYDRISLLLK